MIANSLKLILVTKSQSMGVKDLSIRWTTSYLSNGKQVVELSCSTLIIGLHIMLCDPRFHFRDTIVLCTLKGFPCGLVMWHTKYFFENLYFLLTRFWAIITYLVVLIDFLVLWSFTKIWTKLTDCTE